MGISLPDCSEETMRAFVLACIAVAAVSADADADAYTIAQVNAGIPALKTAFDGQTRVITGVSYGHGLYSGHLGYAGHYGYAAAPYAAYGAHYIGKRSADADADAYTIGQVAAGLPFANAVATGHAHNPGYLAYTSYPTNTVYNTYAAGHVVAPYSAVGYAGAHYIGKRSADADADAYTIGQVAAGLPYANAVATGHAHNPGHIAYTSYPTSAVYNTYAAPYAYGAHHVGYSGVHYLGKRDADADAYTIGQVAAGLPY